MAKSIAPVSRRSAGCIARRWRPTTKGTRAPPACVIQAPGSGVASGGITGCESGKSGTEVLLFLHAIINGNRHRNRKPVWPVNMYDKLNAALVRRDVAYPNVSFAKIVVIILGASSTQMVGRTHSCCFTRSNLH